jgi:hypothetical protein
MSDALLLHNYGSESPAGANSAGISNDARVEIHMLLAAALQSTNFNGT